MKKSTKTMLLTAVALILIGGCFAIGAWAAGATGFSRNFGGLTISVGLHGFQIGPSNWNYHTEAVDEVLVQEGTAEYNIDYAFKIPPEEEQTWMESPNVSWFNGSENGTHSLPWETLSHLDITLGAANFEIIHTSEKDGFLQWEGIEEDTLSFTIDDGCLYLVQDDPNGFFSNLTYLPKKMEIILGLPDKASIESMSLHSGIGNLELEDGVVHEASIELGMGNFKAENVYFNFLEASVGTGDIKLEDCSADELTLYSGLGNVNYEGILHGCASMESGMGNVKATLDSDGTPLSQYSLSLTSGLGKLKIDGKEYSSPYQLSIENAPILNLRTGMGDISLKTK